MAATVHSIVSHTRGSQQLFMLRPSPAVKIMARPPVPEVGRNVGHLMVLVYDPVSVLGTVSTDLIGSFITWGGMGF